MIVYVSIGRGVIIAKRTISFVFLPQRLDGLLAHAQDHRCLAVHGDYIVVGRDFSLGLKNPVYTQIHEHVMRHVGMGGQAVKKGRPVSWAADLICLYLPFGGEHVVGEGTPTWDTLSEDHFKYGIALASSSLSDSGWLLIATPLSGYFLHTLLHFLYCRVLLELLLEFYNVGFLVGVGLGMIERYCRVSGLEIFHRVIVVHHLPYGYAKIAGMMVEVCFLCPTYDPLKCQQ